LGQTQRVRFDRAACGAAATEGESRVLFKIATLIALLVWIALMVKLRFWFWSWFDRWLGLADPAAPVSTGPRRLLPVFCLLLGGPVLIAFSMAWFIGTN
jgi:hypothetical protein